MVSKVLFFLFYSLLLNSCRAFWWPILFHLKDPEGVCSPYEHFCNRFFCERYIMCNTAADPPVETCTRNVGELEGRDIQTEQWVCGPCQDIS